MTQNLKKNKRELVNVRKQCRKNEEHKQKSSYHTRELNANEGPEANWENQNEKLGKRNGRGEILMKVKVLRLKLMGIF